MRIGILGSGMVGQTLGAKLASLGQDVMLGTRDVSKLSEWMDGLEHKVSAGSFAETAVHGELVLNATSGAASLEALTMAGEANLRGKILIDVANPLDFSHGMPPSLLVCNTDSLGEQIQRAFPYTKVVKTLNTLNTHLMIAPEQVADGDHHIFVSGNDEDAKAQVTALLQEWFGWKEVIDLGDITTARGTEMLLPIWVNLMGRLGTPMFNFKIVR